MPGRASHSSVILGACGVLPAHRVSTDLKVGGSTPSGRTTYRNVPQRFADRQLPTVAVSGAAHGATYTRVRYSSARRAAISPNRTQGGIVAPKRRKSRVYWRRGYAYGDFRDFGDAGGGREALIPPDGTRATTDPDIADALVGARLRELELKRRDRVLMGRTRVVHLRRLPGAPRGGQRKRLRWPSATSRTSVTHLAVSASDVCVLNILQKLSRGRHKMTRDTLVDVAGYARNMEMLAPDHHKEPCQDCETTLSALRSLLVEPGPKP